ncbi:thioesterase [Actinoalloteichus sp. AHMU CJ021]|uniref:thioesterase II family protein n=1 Tax=Actinoalloteichus sp. AHMU CJ021 TaxID=2072503 RepID=UPI000CA01F98|nr:thioesterase [Actinoalloteichus sp. AHMU CJ021]
MTGSRWLPFGVPDRAAPRLFCFPHAGAGAAAFAEWRRLAPPEVQVCPLQPPGRAERMAETAHHDLDALLDDLLDDIGDEFTGRYALYGHSMGALVVFELTRRLRARGATPPAHLVVSGRTAPQRRNPRRVLHTLSTAELVPELRRIGGTPEEVLTEPALLELFLPTLRADFAVNENYRYAEQAPLDVPLTVFGGDDDPRATEEELGEWTAQAGAGCTVRVLPGDHFFLVPHAKELVTTATGELLG